MTLEIESQLKAFIYGLEEIIPEKYLKFLSPAELGMYLSGCPEIDSKYY